MLHRLFDILKHSIGLDPFISSNLSMIRVKDEEGDVWEIKVRKVI